MFASTRSFILVLLLFFELCSSTYVPRRSIIGPTWIALNDDSRSWSTKPGYSTCSTTKTFTISITSTSTVTPKTTVTPPAVINTIVKSITLTVPPNPPTVTFTSTSTVSTTSTVTAATSTSTTFTTVTAVTTSTTTITFAAPPGFTPAADTIPEVVSVDPAQKKRRQQPVRRAPGDDSQSIEARGGPPQGNPQPVACTAEVALFTTTALTITLSHTLTITAPTPTSKTTLTKTSIATSTPASTTIIVTSTSTILTTVTPSTTVTMPTTSTSTVFTTQTSYPACANDNIIGTVNGVGIESVTVEPSFVGTNDTTKFDCCVTCLTNPACSAFIFSSNPAVLLPPACQVIIPLTCTAWGQYNDEVNLEPSGQGSGPDQGLFVGNGYCASFDTIFTAGPGGGTVGPGPN